MKVPTEFTLVTDFLSVTSISIFSGFSSFSLIWFNIYFLGQYFSIRVIVMVMKKLMMIIVTTIVSHTKPIIIGPPLLTSRVGGFVNIIKMMVNDNKIISKMMSWIFSRISLYGLTIILKMRTMIHQIAKADN